MLSCLMMIPAFQNLLYWVPVLHMTGVLQCPTTVRLHHAPLASAAKFQLQTNSGLVDARPANPEHAVVYKYKWAVMIGHVDY